MENDSPILNEGTDAASDQEDFFGFNAEDLKRKVFVVKGVSPQDQPNFVNGVGTSRADPSDPKEVDDEIIFVENKVEVIEIDDDDDDEVI